MARKSSYYGFDADKNIVEAPQVYLSNNDFGTANTSVKTISGLNGGYRSFSLMNVYETGDGFPHSEGKSAAVGLGIGMLADGQECFDLFYEPYGNNLYIGGKDASNNWHGWKKLLSGDETSTHVIDLSSVTLSGSDVVNIRTEIEGVDSNAVVVANVVDNISGLLASGRIDDGRVVLTIGNLSSSAKKLGKFRILLINA